MKLKIAITAFSMAALVVACSKESGKDYLKEVNCMGIDAASNTYATTVKPIMESSCAFGGCHDAATRSSGVDLSDYAATRQAFEKKSVLCSINHGSECSRMPKGGAKLPAETIRLLSCWAKNGYAE